MLESARKKAVSWQIDGKASFYQEESDDKRLNFSSSL
jgi:hypothetical protein